MANKITSLEKRLGISGKATEEIKKVRKKEKAEEGRRVNKVSENKVSTPKKAKHQAFMVYLDKDTDALFSQAISQEKSKAEKKSDVSKTLIAEEAITRWMKEKGYLKK
jgi:hypothetical protein